VLEQSIINVQLPSNIKADLLDNVENA